jgi:hypothetical protein
MSNSNNTPNPPSYKDIFENQVIQDEEKNKIIDETYELKNEIKDNQIQAELYRTKYDLTNEDYLYLLRYNYCLEIWIFIISILILWGTYANKIYNK